MKHESDQEPEGKGEQGQRCAAMDEDHGTNTGWRRKSRGGGAGCTAIAAVLVLNALAANVAAFVPPLSSSVRGELTFITKHR